MKPEDDRYLLANDPATGFFNDVAMTSTQAEWIDRLRPTAHAVLTSEIRYNCCQSAAVACSYLICEKDNIVPPAAAKAMIGRVCKDERIDTEVVCDSGHCPWLTKVDVVVEFVKKVADEKMEVQREK